MRVAPITTQERDRFDSLAFEYGTFFNSPAWNKLFEAKLERLGFFNEDDELLGGFYLYRDQRLGVPILRNPPFTPNVGPFFRPDIGKTASLAESHRKFTLAMADYLSTRAFSIVFLPLEYAMRDMLPYLWHKFKVVPQYSYVLDLVQTVDDMHTAMSENTRRNVRKAQRDGLKVVQIMDYHVIEGMICGTFLRQDLTIDTNVLKKIMFDVATPQNSFAYATFSGARILATCFVVHANGTGYYLLGGHEPRDGHYGAGPVAFWEAIKHAKEIGLERFDFEGSVIPNIERFFRGFGGRLETYYVVAHAPLLLEIALKITRRQYF
jgi:hypothetical protein